MNVIVEMTIFLLKNPIFQILQIGTMVRRYGRRQCLCPFLSRFGRSSHSHLFRSKIEKRSRWKMAPRGRNGQKDQETLRSGASG